MGLDSGREIFGLSRGSLSRLWFSVGYHGVEVGTVIPESPGREFSKTRPTHHLKGT